MQIKTSKFSNELSSAPAQASFNNNSVMQFCLSLRLILRCEMLGRNR